MPRQDRVRIVALGDGEYWPLDRGSVNGSLSFIGPTSGIPVLKQCLIVEDCRIGHAGSDRQWDLNRERTATGWDGRQVVPNQDMICTAGLWWVGSQRSVDQSSRQRIGNDQIRGRD